METPGCTLVIGASGYLGQALVSRLRRRGTEVSGTYCEHESPSASIPYDFWTDDLSERLAGRKVDIVIFAASVERESEGEDSFRAFSAAVRRLLEACDGRRFVYVSSDAVFDGTDGHYDESDDPSPGTGYGRRLETFDRLVAEHVPDYCIVRPSYLFGFSRGRLDHRLTRACKRLEAGELVAYYDDYYKSPIEVNEAATVIGTLAATEFTGIVHAGGPRTSAYEFYRDAMDALDRPARTIERTQIPSDQDLPADTSLNSELLRSLTGIRPSSVETALDTG